ALEAHRSGERAGRPLNIVSRWARLAAVVIVVVMVAVVSFAATAENGEYAEGVAVVRREARGLVTSAVAGTVHHIEAEPGRRGAAGTVPVLLDDAPGQAEFARAKQSSERRLVELLRDAGTHGKRERLAGSDAALQLAEGKLRERKIVAAEAGLVSDVRVRAG